MLFVFFLESADKKRLYGFLGEFCTTRSRCIRFVFSFLLGYSNSTCEWWFIAQLPRKSKGQNTVQRGVASRCQITFVVLLRISYGRLLESCDDPIHLFRWKTTLKIFWSLSMAPNWPFFFGHFLKESIGDGVQKMRQIIFKKALQIHPSYIE